MRASTFRLTKPIIGLAQCSRLCTPKPFILQAFRPTAPSRILPQALSSIRKYSTSSDVDSPAILPPPKDSSSPPSTPSSSKVSSNSSFRLLDRPTYELTFTCKKCNERSSHKMSKQAYHKGTVLIQCPGCQVRHLIADHLKIFRDNPTTIEDILREKGEKITKGVKYNNGDIEILPDEEGGGDVKAGEGEEKK
ncbi:hypothetical protein ABW20_dc0109070 [Dactylellina cionopaga]|nr:hypothetical protein ABW20_dc0109070 [Dactylellina cionopaga]